MKVSLPSTDSIAELARFWDEHDVTDFDDQLIEVESPFASRLGEAVPVALDEAEREAVHRLARARGLDDASLIREWVREKLKTAG